MRHALATISLSMLLGVGAAQAATTVDDKALANEQDGANWLGYGRTYSEQRFSPLDQINADNVAKLGLAWSMDLPKDRSLNGTPLAVDGVLYFPGSYNVVYAVEAATGKLLWTYDPKVIDTAGDRLRVMWDSSRGLAFWNGKVYDATVDGRLIAIDAKTGKEVWNTMTVDPRKALFITGAPKVFRGKVIIGNGGTEWGPARGYVTAYDAETGKQAWRFWVVPGNPADGFENKTMEMAAKTWTGEWWKYGGGGTVWNGITYDPEFNQVLIGTGNGSPWNQKIRSPGGGDNLFLCAIVALDADTGEYKWHYQTTPGETWDYNSNMDIVLADLKYGGQTIKALMHAPKNGFFYILNRANGELLSAEKIGKVTWAERIDLKSGRPVEVKGARYEDGEELVWPSAVGVHSWHAMAYSPDTGLSYIPSIEMPGLFNDKSIALKTWKSPDFAFDPAIDTIRGDVPANSGKGYLRAYDPLSKKMVWEQPLPGIWNPGVVATHGNLVFQGRTDGRFVAYRATDGKPLWQVELGHGISAPPITYTVDGKQYVSLLVGWGGTGASMVGSIAAQHGWAYKAQTRRLYTFALDAKTPIPPSNPPYFPKPLEAKDFQVDDKLAEEGSWLFKESCAMCHGGGAVSGGYAPDLRASPIPLNAQAFKDVVVNGQRRPLGMPDFKQLDDHKLDTLRHFIRRQAGVPQILNAAEAPTGQTGH
ncbi:MAG: PQQ-dependent dehydrogenase, methanol/ethanol family [Gammaproteobacteria bacterium]|nr:PQQ-dependent dehydrogenase, methanol/ethanol family [Gammaproteobacteria bacterium]